MQNRVPTPLRRYVIPGFWALSVLLWGLDRSRNRLSKTKRVSIPCGMKQRIASNNTTRVAVLKSCLIIQSASYSVSIWSVPEETHACLSQKVAGWAKEIAREIWYRLLSEPVRKFVRVPYKQAQITCEVSPRRMVERVSQVLESLYKEHNRIWLRLETIFTPVRPCRNPWPYEKSMTLQVRLCHTFLWSSHVFARHILGRRSLE